jgi:ribosome maturation protein Sdo1
MNDEKRTKIVTMRLTPSEKEKLDQIVSENNVKNLSEFMRQIVLTGQYKNIDKCRNNYEKFLYELNRIGNNLNQIAKQCNINKSVDIQVLEQLARIEDMLEILIEE